MREALYDARMDRALAFAADAFRARTRKETTVPYLSHLLAVTALVMENGGGPDECIAAVLHDYLEDIPGASLDELRASFGDEVSRIVLALSDTTDATNKAPWRERKDAYVARLRDADPGTKLVAACDKLHNARSVVLDQSRTGDAAFDRFSATKRETLWYYRAVLDALRAGWDARVLEELDAVVGDMHRLAGEGRG
jgi:(p)ppGpp synthase/HD superfamily hydrolase